MVDDYMYPAVIVGIDDDSDGTYRILFADDGDMQDEYEYSPEQLRRCDVSWAYSLHLVS